MRAPRVNSHEGGDPISSRVTMSDRAARGIEYEERGPHDSTQYSINSNRKENDARRTKENSGLGDYCEQLGERERAKIDVNVRADRRAPTARSHMYCRGMRVVLMMAREREARWGECEYLYGAGAERGKD